MEVSWDWRDRVIKHFAHDYNLFIPQADVRFICIHPAGVLPEKKIWHHVWNKSK